MYHRTCRYAEGCATIASFAPRGHGQPLYCALHKAPGDAVVYRQRCAERGCALRALFADPGARVKTHCARHRLPHQVPPPPPRRACATLLPPRAQHPQAQGRRAAVQGPGDTGAGVLVEGSGVVRGPPRRLAVERGKVVAPRRLAHAAASHELA
jgi:hypothetical protein